MSSVKFLASLLKGYGFEFVVGLENMGGRERNPF
jgi:hypothetical protein